MADKLFDAWCSNQEFKEKLQTLRLLAENPGSQSKAIEVLRAILPNHYCDPAVIEKRLQKWGYEKALEVLRSTLPTSKKARSGDMGEILATEYVNRKLDYKTPILKLRWRDDREMALRGDDIFAVRIGGNGELHFLKGEVKSRQTFGEEVLDEVTKALRRHGGRPAPYTVNFVVSRLAYENENTLYEALENYLTPKSIPPKRVTHLVFVLSGNDPQSLLQTYVEVYKGTTQILVVGFQIKNHKEFIKTVFDGVKLA